MNVIGPSGFTVTEVWTSAYREGATLFSWPKYIREDSMVGLYTPQANTTNSRGSLEMYPPNSSYL